MKKLVKKIVVAVMAMAMAIGMLTVSASADNLDVTADTNKWYVLGSWDWSNKIEMTYVEAEDCYRASVDLTAGTEYEFVVYVNDGTKDIYVKNEAGGGNYKYTPAETGKFTVTIYADQISNGDNYWTDTFYVKLFSDPSVVPDVETRVGIYAGDKAPFVAIAAVAVLALGAVVVLASKKKVVTE